MNVVLRALSAKGERSLTIAAAICRLIVLGAELGELEQYSYFDGVEWRIGRRMPREWLDRLEAAIERDVLGDLSAKRIAEILLQPLPEREKADV